MISKSKTDVCAINGLKKLLRPVYVPIVNILKQLSSDAPFLLFLLIHIDADAFIIGSPTYSNLGDSAILLAEKLFLEKCGYCTHRIIEITYEEYYQHYELLHMMLSNKVHVFCMGGGNMGNQWVGEDQIRFDIIETFSRNRITVFPQTIHFVGDASNEIQISKEHYNTCKNLTLVARERTSERIMRGLYPDARILLAPDIVLSTDMNDYGVIRSLRSGVLFISRQDAEKEVDSLWWKRLKEDAIYKRRGIREIDMYSDVQVTKENRLECVRRKMQVISAAELVVTDRLHAMVFAAITGTPCIAFNNYNHKIAGTYDWISYLPYIKLAKTYDEAKVYLEELLELGEQEYNAKPLSPYYESLIRAIRNG